MNTTPRIFISLFIVTIYVGLAMAQGDPTAKLTYKKIEITIIDNPFVDEWIGEIAPSGETISIKVPMKADIPPTMMMKGNIAFMGSDVGSIDMPMCQAFQDEIFAKSVLEAGVPKGKFPQGCPIKAGADYEIKDYVFPRFKLLPGLPDGLAVIDAEFYEPGKDPYAVAHVEVELSHKVPGLGR